MPLKTLGSRRLVRQTALGLRVQHVFRFTRATRPAILKYSAVLENSCPASQQRREVLRDVHLGQVIQKQ